MILFKRILIDAESTPIFLDFNILEHHQVYTQTSNIIIAVSECARFKNFTDSKMDEMSKDIFLYLNQIRVIAGDKMSLRVYRWTLRKIREYEEYANELEQYEYSNNLFKLYTNLFSPIKNKHNLED